MSETRFATRLAQEFEQRRRINPRYSLRAFALWLGSDHSTVSQILRGQRGIPLRLLRAWGRKLGLHPEEITAYVAAEQLPDAAEALIQFHQRQWVAEAMAILADPLHQQILGLVETPDFQADCRWIAERTGSTVDAVNIAWTRLLRLRLVETDSQGRWTKTNQDRQQNYAQPGSSVSDHHEGSGSDRAVLLRAVRMAHRRE